MLQEPYAFYYPLSNNIHEIWHWLPFEILEKQLQNDVKMYEKTNSIEKTCFQMPLTTQQLWLGRGLLTQGRRLNEEANNKHE